MNEPTICYLSSQLKKFKMESLLKFYSSDTQASIKKAMMLETDISTDPIEKLKNIHYSWFYPLLEKHGDEVKQLLIANLPAQTAFALLKGYHLPKIQKIQNPFLKSVLLKMLYFHIYNRDILQKKALPKSSLSLLELNIFQLEQLFDFLGLYDLASELKEVLDKELILAIFKHLSSKEKSFIKECLAKKQLWSLPKIGIQTWTKEVKGFRHVLQKRGLIRFCVGLCGQHKDFIWHLMHKLDTGRAKFLEKLVQDKPIPPATQTVITQINSLVHRLQGAKI